MYSHVTRQFETADKIDCELFRLMADARRIADEAQKDRRFDDEERWRELHNAISKAREFSLPLMSKTAYERILRSAMP